MNKIIENAVKANYENYSKFINENRGKFSVEEFFKVYKILSKYEKMYNKYFWGFGAFDNPDYF